MATIYDVARRAKTSAATVSRAVSGNGYVKDETRVRVLKAVDELNYKPKIIPGAIANRKRKAEEFAASKLEEANASNE
jgi:LacI family transcriptional regulator